MTEKQRKGLSKYLYDISKIVFTLAILGNALAWEKFNPLIFSLGIIGAAFTFIWAYSLDGKEEQNE